jgi:HSP20 family molecular chaperone IbpA
MSAQFRTEPRLNFFKENPGYSFSLNVQDLKDRFEVRAFLPNAKASDVNVSLQNNQTLKVEVSNKNTETSNQTNNVASVTEWGQYEQTIQLPAPVKADQLKIDRQGHELLITLPKA